jgi:hypothetical protein
MAGESWTGLSQRPKSLGLSDMDGRQIRRVMDEGFS